MSDQNEWLGLEEPEENQTKGDTVTDDLFVSDQLLIPIVEAIIFAAESPVTVNQIKAILDEGKEEFPSDVSLGRIMEVLERIKIRYENDDFAFSLHNIADGYFFMTKAVHAQWIGRLYKNHQVKKTKSGSIGNLSHHFL